MNKITDDAVLVQTAVLISGTEATEAALKLMRMNGQKNNKKRLGIIAIENNWHGRTLGAQMMSSNKAQKEWIGYHDKNIHHLPFPYPWLTNEDEAEKFLEKSLNKIEKKFGKIAARNIVEMSKIKLKRKILGDQI